MTTTTSLSYIRIGVSPANHVKEKIISFSELCNLDGARLLFNACSNFQRVAVKKWNPYADEVTLSNYIGLVGIDEAASKECGALTLDMLVKFGILEKDGGGLWNLTRTTIRSSSVLLHRNASPRSLP